MISTWWGLALLAIGVAAVSMLVTAYAARRAGRVSVVDVTWGLALAAISVAAAILGTGTPWRRWLVAVLVIGVGCATVAAHLQRGPGARVRTRGTPRCWATAASGPRSRRSSSPQGLAICLVALPVMAAAHWDVELPGWSWVGVVVWAVGTAFEAVGDAQLAAYKRDPDRGPVMDRGLWGWTRHPNYFGDALVWWGIWLAGGAASGWWPGLVSVLAPLAMTHFLRNVTGARLLERTMSQRPGWDEYAARVPLFVPRPPRRP